MIITHISSYYHNYISGNFDCFITTIHHTLYCINSQCCKMQVVHISANQQFTVAMSEYFY